MSDFEKWFKTTEADVIEAQIENLEALRGTSDQHLTH